MKFKRVELTRAYRFPGQTISEETLIDIEGEWRNGVLALVFGDEVHDIPSVHVKRAVRDLPSVDRQDGRDSKGAKK